MSQSPNEPAAQDSVPTWFQAAEAAYEERTKEELASSYLSLKRQVDAINAKLAELGITDPINLAAVDSGPRLVPAQLVDFQFADATYEVYVNWSDTYDQPALAVQPLDDAPYRDGPRYSRVLDNLADIAAAAHEGPAPHLRQEQTPGINLSAWAERTLKELSADNLSPEAYAIGNQISGVTAALLHLADTGARTNSRT